jgi:hypothetical protein
MTSPVVLIAAIDQTLLEAIFAIAVLIIAGVAKLLAAMQQKNPPGNLRGPQAPIPGQPAEQLRDFLERAAKARQVERPRPAAQPQARPAQVRPAQAQPAIARPLADKPVDAQVVDAPVGARLGKQIEKDIDTREFTQRSTQLGSEVAAADRQIDERLHKVFDHHVSKLELVPGESAAAPVAVGPADLPGAPQPDAPALSLAGLADLITNPDTLCQAIVLNEVLRRPEDRW